MQSHYEINVALNGQHLFATSERSCVIKMDYDRVLAILLKKFPESEGYTVSAVYLDIVGKVVHQSEKYRP